MIKSISCSLLFLLTIVSCSTQKNEGFNVFKGNSEYHSETISTQLAKEYNLDQESRMIVVLTQNKNLPQYQEQLEILRDKIDAEEEGLIYVIGNLTELNKSSYAITSAQTKTMLGKDQFQIRIYHNNGKLKKQSQSVLSASQIKNILGEELKVEGEELKDDDFIVHEWGSFNVIQGSDQAIIGGLVDDQSDLPDFVHVWKEKPFKTELQQIMEKPIIYFYTKQERHATVDVSVPKGIITQWWPPVTHYYPYVQNGKIPELKNGSVNWRYLTIKPDYQGKLANVNNHPWWPIARETDSATVISSDNTAEKFLFYRGIGDYQPALKGDFTNGSWSFNAKGNQKFSHVMAINVDDKGQVTINHYNILNLDQKTEPTVVSSPAAAVAILEKALLEKGLYEKEAKGMMKIWKDSFFKTSGSRFMYFMEDEALEQMLPLYINPKPTEQKRVMLVRVELLSKARENEIRTLVNQLSFSDKRYKKATRALMKEGRAGQALMRKFLSKTEDPTIKQRLEHILEQISPLRPSLKQ